jgi:hypothetical protein
LLRTAKTVEQMRPAWAAVLLPLELGFSELQRGSIIDDSSMRRLPTHEPNDDQRHDHPLQQR